VRDLLLFVSVFLACAVEAVEALTIVLAVGTTRGWRSTWYGVGSAGVVLAAVVLALGPALTAIPIDALRIVVGALLLTFGLQWLRKAILRATGLKDLRDEDAAYAKEIDEAAVATRTARGPVDDWYAYTVAFKGVTLEGLEVAFIVVTFGANQNNFALSIAGAVLAVIVVAAAGVAVHRPLARVPENTMKFVVGIMLTSFGIFWGAEGAGVSWPGGDVALIGVIGYIAVVALVLVRVLRRQSAAASPGRAAEAT
jgi:uncharacterized membrane protein